MHRQLLLIGVVLLAWHRDAAADPQETPAFAGKPSVTRSGDAVKIDFAVVRETDVAVYVENSKGEIVRHLVAGRLGKNPPEPLKAGSLAQSLTWDGKDDDGKPAAGGPFRVRVGLGLKPSWGGLAFADPARSGPNMVESVIGLAPGPDGRMIVLSHCGAWLYWSTTRIHVFRRDGSYEKTIKPFPPTLPPERVKAAGAFVNSFGGINPIVYRPLGFSFYPHDDVAHQPAVTPAGRLVLATRTADTNMYGGHAVGVGHLAMIDSDGGVPEAEYGGPSLKGGWTSFPYLVSAPDGKTVYFTGLGAHNSWGASKPWHAVYRAGLPGRGPQEVFFGDPAASGNDMAHLNDPRGVAVDGKGHLFVADAGNNRVVMLKESDKSFVGSLDVPSPDWLAVHPKTGSLYVQSGDSVIKFSTNQAVSRLELPKQKDARWRLALDASAEPPVIWAGCRSMLVRSEDQGTKFGELVPAGCIAPRLLWRPAVDPTRKVIACRIGNSYGSKLHLLDEATGQERVLGTDVAGTEGRTHRLGPDGSIYAVDHNAGIIRYDSNGKLQPFPATANDPVLKGRLGVGATGTTAWERDFWVDRRNELYVRKRGPEYHGHMDVDVYDHQGQRLRTVLWTVSDAMYGPRVDARGNLYIMDMIKPVGEPYPKEFESRLTTKRTPHWYNWIYGSVIKFGPEGGAIWFADGAASPLSYEGWRLTQANSVTNLRTTGGSLRGDITKKTPEVGIPAGNIDAAAQNRIVLRLKNESSGSQAVLSYHVVGEPYGTAPRKKAIPVQPNSDFTEYTFDMAGEKDWKGTVHGLSLSPSDAAKGSFSIDWVQIPGGKNPKVWNFDREDSQETKLPATLKKEEVAAYTKPRGTMLQGAQWWRPGFAPLGKTQGNDTCHCTASDFDMDDFGRIFVPDNGRFRIGVLDSNGNDILSFGAYGNQDFCGPESYVADPATKILRPRKADDPKELKSPFASPEIALGWVVGLAVTDRYAYVDDVLNKRMLRVKLDYSVSETLAVP